MLNKLRHFLLRIIYPITRVIGKLEIITGKLPKSFYADSILKIQPGDIVISYIKFNLLNYFIKGHFTHAAIVLNRSEIIEAVGPKVKRTGLWAFLKTKDEVVILRKKDSDVNDGLLIAMNAKSYLETPYDYEFDFSQKALYCAELCYHSIHGALPEWNFRPLQVWGEPTVLPQDFLDATKHFDVILDSREMK